MSTSRDEEAARLFGTETVPSVPDAQVAETTNVARNDSPPTDFSQHHLPQNTLDETVFATFKRDFVRIGMNLKGVLLPFLKDDEKSRSLRNWDLWGPLLFILLLGIILSARNNEDASTVFTMTFVVLALGAVILTVNIILLGGTIVFFQSLCLLGYSLFPIVVAAAATAIADKAVVLWPVTILGVAWSVWAAFRFVKEATPDNKRMMALYPVLLLYLCVGWMVIVV